jgi:Protein of unknown function (DUF3800)
LAYLFFIDESGQDHGKSPYEVRCAVAVHDSRLWDLTLALVNAELSHFGVHYSGPLHELKARELLDRRTFRIAAQIAPLDADERSHLARQALISPRRTTWRNLVALRQAKLAFCREALEICAAHQVAYFACIVDPRAPRSARSGLTRDYTSLFRGLFSLLEQHDSHERGLLVMDEIDRSEAHRLIRRMRTYFRRTRFGREQRHRVVPEPFFVHSDLTTGVQIADIVAYVLSWNVRLPGMTRARRVELDTLGDLVKAQYRAYSVPGIADDLWSFVYLDDLRTNYERGVRALPPLAAAGVSPN